MNYSHAPAIIDELQTIPLDFADAFLSPGVSTSPRVYARNGAPRRWLGHIKILSFKQCLNILFKEIASVVYQV
jgi:hypothetical protein